MVKWIDYIGIMVRDINVFIIFYEEVFGMKLKDCIIYMNGVIEFVFFGFEDGLEIEIELI